jgi:tRNA pseudouridine65 synthase
MRMVPATRLLSYADSAQRHADASLEFVDKPAGMLVHSSAFAGPREHALVDDVAVLLGPGWHPLHRLDRQTSGVVAFAREGEVARWQAAMAHADKRYWALVRGHVSAAVEIDHALRDDDAPAGAVAKEARSLVTPLLLSSVERCSLVEVRLFTGRRHQARRHLKHISHPVIGDANHGKGPLNRAYRARWGVLRMALHARSLAIPPLGAVVAPLPEDLAAPFARLFDAAALEALEALAAR